MDTAAKPGTLQMIADFSNAKAPSGFEEETIAAARKHIGCGYETEEDCLRNFYMYRKANTGKKPFPLPRCWCAINTDSTFPASSPPNRYTL